MSSFTHLIIEGKRVPSRTAQTFDVKNPYSGVVVGTAAAATQEDCAAAIESAAHAFESWENVPLTQKRDIFLRAADIVGTNTYREKVAAALKAEVSAPDYWCTFNWIGVSSFLRTNAGLIHQLQGRTFPSDTVPGARVLVEHRAKGVILSIAPWNAPFFLTIRAIAAPIICGNTVVLKSSEYSPRTQAIVAELFEEAGLPAGVLNYICMPRESSPELTALMIAHPAVRAINFTGSDRVGRIIASEAAKHLKPCVLELGGKGPAVVLNDANVHEAARVITHGAMIFSGQVCLSTERVIVQREVADALVSTLHDFCAGLKAGNPVEGAQLGPLFTEASAKNVITMLEEGIAAGAELVLGDLKRAGAVIQPHILKNVRPGMRIWERESFGPVLVIAIAESVEEAVVLANSSEYSLSAALWSSNEMEAIKVASRIRAGCTSINGVTLHTEPTAPNHGLGGASGYGNFDVAHFTDARNIVVYGSTPRGYLV